MFDVVCIGNIVADVIVRTVDELPPKGSLVYKENISLYNGGCAMSSAVDMAILGINTAIIAKTGNDSFGDFLKNKLILHGVDISGLRSGDYPTSASVAMIDSCSERSFLHCPGANAFFTDKDVDYSIIENSKTVFAAGMMIMPAFDGEPCMRVLRRAKELGKITALDTAWDSEGLWMKKLKPCMKYIDFFMPSYEEAEKLSGETDVTRMADVFFDMGVGHVVIKLGKDGCYLRKSKSGEGQYFPAYTNVTPIDTTGAGDAFCAGFLYGLSKDKPLEVCCKIGSATGALSVTQMGATGGVLPFDGVEKFMKDQL